MKNYTIKRYNSEYFTIWNAFVSSSSNATFLFHRDFMEYHSDRFEDYSLLVFEDEKLISILPANRVDDTIFSHQGLTYGGFVFENDISILQIKLVILNTLSFLKENNFKTLKIKEIVSIYLTNSNKGISSFLLESGAIISSKKMNLAIDFKSDFKVSKSKLKHFKRINSIGLEIKKEGDLSIFWNEVLIPRLDQKFGSKPVHSIDEISKLKVKFPENIYQYNVYLDNEILAGITIFKTNNVIKSQYGTTTENGEKYRALDFLYINLINEFKDEFDFFDMGTVDDDSELGYNIGLFNQKKELGCSVFEQNFYELLL